MSVPRGRKMSWLKRILFRNKAQAWSNEGRSIQEDWIVIVSPIENNMVVQTNTSSHSVATVPEASTTVPGRIHIRICPAPTVQDRRAQRRQQRIRVREYAKTLRFKVSTMRRPRDGVRGYGQG